MKKLMFCGLFLFLYLEEVIASHYPSGSIKRTYFKVSNVLPGSNAVCQLESQDVTSSEKNECLFRCASIPRCSLVCSDGSKCMYWTSKVSHYWDASRYPKEAKQTVSGFQCYSSHFFENDITGKVVGVRGIDHKNYKKEVAVDGFICGESNRVYWSAGANRNPWIELELDRPYLIRKVLVFARKLKGWSTDFAKTEFRVGLSPGSGGDFSSQTYFGFYQGLAKDGEVVTIEASVPVLGKYVSLKKTGAYQTLSDIKILT